MGGLVLTGPTGVGKSTAQRRLCEDFGFWTPRTRTTRQIAAAESEMLHVPEAVFLEQVRAQELLLPALFGENWYAWTRDDIAKLKAGEGQAVLNVRPYTALVLQGLCVDLAAVWLALPPLELSQRRASRGAARDKDESLRKVREAQDLDDSIYESCFSHVLRADDSLLDRLLALSG